MFVVVVVVDQSEAGMKTRRGSVSPSPSLEWEANTEPSLVACLPTAMVVQLSTVGSLVLHLTRRIVNSNGVSDVIIVVGR